jgi:hypothetical protein
MRVIYIRFANNWRFIDTENYLNIVKYKRRRRQEKYKESNQQGLISKIFIIERTSIIGF